MFDPVFDPDIGQTTQPDFAHTGRMLIRPNGGPITRYQVMGERSSGTNFVKRLIGRNTALTPSEALGWKHGFPHMTAVPPDMLVIGCVRRADTWARSMHAKPWHCPPEMQAMGFSRFIRAPWATILDRARYFDGAEALGTVGQPLQHDRHPLTGAVFDDIFALRRAKLQGLLSHARRGCAFLLVRMEDVQAEPEAFLDWLRGALDLGPAQAPYRPVVKRLGSKFKPSVATRPETPDALSGDDLAYLRSRIDPDQETALGYAY